MSVKIEAVIFDMDGVIFDSEKLVLDSWKEVADRHGIKGVQDVCRECLGTNSAVSKKIFLQHYGQEFPYDIYKEEMSKVFFSHASDGRLAKKPGIEELLKYLREKKIKVGLASSTREVLVRQELTDGGLISYFDEVVCGDMVKRSKPEPDIFLEACRRLGARAENCYVIEDSYNGIRAAYAAGMHPVMIPDLAQPTEEMERLAECILPNLMEMVKFLKDQFCN